ncbi:hypothetical protein [Bacillus sp. B-jedd]|uniref:hypothetical protein n=1 Tax=Bacillus sp. B-jedd TaxID=1476857 RepID=UPI0005156868|nr:hypothetical protein [Bacillus sp. B-jedd]CEG27877.1 Hypothetical protein BN1002_02750 [Bacillus sp. B-jedd]
MKKMAVSLLILTLILSIYTDLTKGTLPVNRHVQEEPVEEMKESTPDRPFYKATIMPGQTLLSIIEQKHGKVPVPINKMIEDFQVLNPGVTPEKLQIGKEYLFPSYAGGDS